MTTHQRHLLYSKRFLYGLKLISQTFFFFDGFTLKMQENWRKVKRPLVTERKIRSRICKLRVRWSPENTGTDPLWSDRVISWGWKNRLTSWHRFDNGKNASDLRAGEKRPQGTLKSCLFPGLKRAGISPATQRDGQTASGWEIKMRRMELFEVQTSHLMMLGNRSISQRLNFLVLNRRMIESPPPVVRMRTWGDTGRDRG